MATVPRTTTTIQHHAYYGDVYGTATLLNGSGYLFREEGRQWWSHRTADGQWCKGR